MDTLEQQDLHRRISRLVTLTRQAMWKTVKHLLGGRALAALGIGIGTSIASSNEVSMAISKQANSTKTTKAPNKKEATTPTLYQKAVTKLTEKPTQEYFDEIISKVGTKFTAAQKKKLQAIVK